MRPAHRIARLVLPLLLVAAAPQVRADDPPAPTFTNVTVHDPSVVKAGSRWYVYGSHGASAWTADWMRWNQVATSVSSGNPSHFNTFQSELAELISWTAATTLWAADVIQLGDGKFYYYYNVWTDHQSYRSYMGLAVADTIEGPFTDLGEIMKGGTGVSGFNPSVHPNTIDPDVFFDREGRLWMVYGSYSGGIFILELDATAGSTTLGRPLPGQGWGTRLIGGNHAQIEGGYVLYSPESEYYYLFVSFGGLAANGGYNMRVFRSVNPNGPYVDAAGSNMATTPIANSQWSTIAPYGVKIMGNFQFQAVAGETGTTLPGYVSPGHNSAYYDPVSGQYFLIFHTRFVGRGEVHEVRVHPMFLNADGWFAVAPHRYAGETLATLDAGRVVGTYKLINHGKDITATVKNSSTITLAADGSVSGSVAGTWQLSGDAEATVILDGVTHRGEFVRQWDASRSRWVTTFTAIDGASGTSVWGSKAALDVVPSFLTQPAGASVAAGTPVTLRAVAAGEPAPTFQWRRNGMVIDGETGATLALGKVGAAATGTYTVVATNRAGTATSAEAVVSVTVPPVITSHPASLTQPAGASASFAVTATGSGTLTYQWLKNDTVIDGATESTLSLTAIQAADAGDYTVRVTDGAVSTTSRFARLVVATPGGGRLSNASVRSTAGINGAPLIVGFVVSGGSKEILVRGVGPTLHSLFDLPGTMPDPWIEMHHRVGENDIVVATNDNWADGGQHEAMAALFQTLGAFPLPDTSADAAMLASVSGPHTVHISSRPPFQSGIVLVECYDAVATNQPRLVNVSARNFAGVAEQTLIAGFVIEGNEPRRVMIRGVGPTLQDLGVTGVLADPRLEVHTTINRLDRVIASNDDWSSEPEVAASSRTAGAFALRENSFDAAIVMVLPAGVYTAHVSGGDGLTGEALVEVYELP